MECRYSPRRRPGVLFYPGQCRSELYNSQLRLKLDICNELAVDIAVTLYMVLESSGKGFFPLNKYFRLVRHRHVPTGTAAAGADYYTSGRLVMRLLALFDLTSVECRHYT